MRHTRVSLEDDMATEVEVPSPHAPVFMSGAAHPETMLIGLTQEWQVVDTRTNTQASSEGQGSFEVWGVMSEGWA